MPEALKTDPKPFLGLSDNTKFFYGDFGELFVIDDDLGPCRVDLSLPPSKQILIPVEE